MPRCLVIIYAALPPRDATISPFSFLSKLSIQHPKLEQLDLTLNHLPGAGVPALSSKTLGYLFRNTFPYLTYLRLSGRIEPPSPEIVTSFFLSHPQLRQLALNRDIQSVSFPDHSNALPNLEYRAGHFLFVAAICRSSKTSRQSVLDLHSSGAGFGREELQSIDTRSIYALQIFPKLPKLQTFYMSLGGEVSPSFLKNL